MSLTGCFTLKPRKKDVIAPAKIIKWVIGIASSASKPRITNRIGISNAPPPIPPALEIAEPINKTNNPMISWVSKGKTFLCEQKFSLLQIFKYGQSLSSWHSIWH